MKPLIKLLNLELAGGCNYSCNMCPQSTGRETNFKKILNFDLFKKIVDESISYGVEVVTLHGSGEPTLHKNFIDCIKYVKDKGLSCQTFTNGYYIDEKIVDSGIDMIRFSVTGYDEHTYNIWMKSNAFYKVRDNAKWLVDAGINTHSNHLILDNSNIEFEVEKYKEWIDYTGTQAEIWKMHNWADQYNPKDKRFGKKRSCGRPHHPTLEVRAGGLIGHSAAVVGCCMVLGKDSEAVLGHLDESTIEEIYNGPSYEELRKAHEEERFDDISYCKNCDQLYESESLVWANIKNRKQHQLKALSGTNYEFLK